MGKRREVRLHNESIDCTARQVAWLCQNGLIEWRSEHGAYIVRHDMGKDWTHVEAALEAFR